MIGKIEDLAGSWTPKVAVNLGIMISQAESLAAVC